MPLFKSICTTKRKPMKCFALATLTLFLSLALLAVNLLGAFDGPRVAQASEAAGDAAGHFNDVGGHWAVDDDGENWLQYVYENGIMTGYKDANGEDARLFGPDDSVTRGQVATILFRCANPDDASTDDPSSFGTVSSFSDVPANAYYTSAIEWCKRMGIVVGDTDGSGAALGTFRPEDAVSRQELATMLFRFANAMDSGNSAGDFDGAAFRAMPDAGDVASYASDAMGWCYAHGILTGSKTSEGALLLPEDFATRAQMAKMITVTMRDVLGDVASFAMLYDTGETVQGFVGEDYSLQDIPMYRLVIQRGGIPESGSLKIGLDGTVTCGDGLIARWDGIESLNGEIPWKAEYAINIASVSVRDPFRPTFAQGLFADLPNCSSFDLGETDLSATDDLERLFQGDGDNYYDEQHPGLKGLDLSGVTVSANANATGMIEGCGFLEKVVLGASSSALAPYLTTTFHEGEEPVPWTSEDGVTYTRPLDTITITQSELEDMASGSLPLSDSDQSQATISSGAGATSTVDLSSITDQATDSAADSSDAQEGDSSGVASGVAGDSAGSVSDGASDSGSGSADEQETSDGAIEIDLSGDNSSFVLDPDSTGSLDFIGVTTGSGASFDFDELLL